MRAGSRKKGDEYNMGIKVLTAFLRKLIQFGESRLK